MTLTTTDSHQINKLKTSKMQSGIVSNKVILGVSAFSVSFGLSLVPNWDFTQALVTGIITVLATYSAALFVDKRRRNYELMVLSSLYRKIRELEGLKYRIAREVEQVQQHKILLYTESQQLQNQIAESRNQRDNLHREIGNFAGQKKHLELEINTIKNAIDKLEGSTIELKKSCSELTAEKRRLELNCNVSRSEITQLQAQIEAFKQEKEEIENHLILSNRLKPQLEEKLYELRIEIQDLESKVFTKNNLLKETINAQENLENKLKNLQNQKQAQQAEISQLHNQISLLQDERDLLQNQVWELLQNIENLNQEPLSDNTQENEVELFPFDELLEPIEEKLPSEWRNFLAQMPTHQIQVLKAIIEHDNPQAIIKQIAEAQITMPNLLIDAINEIAKNTIGELIIETAEDKPEIYPEHLLNVQKIIAIHED
ncbi:tellurite resistance TerB C-terminal domain-containing protein [Sphaerospermopsis sp. LEGE 00249]|uniref:tellurite resistance TerB C-terminal domain-containing protein n=1 Tax=Sphaerospermopsis sp. LEGE 00249 TaxID=1380707 RepID=UPI002106830A|nr:tellurite resistance TerB C-terminal domain-containing protein [Sphaerospermopsis sp. LEGE 00249]